MKVVTNIFEILLKNPILFLPFIILFLLSLPKNLLFLIPYFLFYFFILSFYPKLILDIGRKELRVSYYLNISKKKFLKIIILTLLLGVIVAIPFLPLIPILFFYMYNFKIILLIFLASFLVSYYFYLRLSISLPILVIENISVINSIKKSWKLMKNKVLKFFIYQLLVIIIFLIPSLFFALIIFFILKNIYYIEIFSTFISSIISCILITFQTLFYKNIKKI